MSWKEILINTPNNNVFPLKFNLDWIIPLQDKLKQDGPWDKWSFYQLNYEKELLLANTEFNQLQALRFLPNLQPFPHQIETAQKVINEMHGRAILADEVGLGKTIEAGIIIKEYLVRGLAKKILILVPSSLIIQWTRELNQKFDIPAVAQKKEYMWNTYDILVSSIDTAKRSPHRDIILQNHYDLLIIDEAHKLKNKKTKNYEFVNQIKKKYILLLTATPIQNDMIEIFNLINLLKPGQLGDYQNYQKRYMKDKRTAKNSEILQEEIKEVLIRNKRADSSIEFTERYVEPIPIELTSAEKELYSNVTNFVKDRYRSLNANPKAALSLITLQREVCSSKDATFITLVNMFKKSSGDLALKDKILELVQIAKKVSIHSKAIKSLELIKKINDKVIIFTEYRATQEYLLQFFRDNGLIAVPYRGGFNRGKKDWMRELFSRKAQILVATEAGGEGINLQFANQVINYDLPWNPMRVEQRIGRVHRLGQTRDVYIYNFTTIGTIEEYIFKLLHQKIKLFENVIGNLDDILTKINTRKNLENDIMNLFVEASDEEDFTRKLENFTNTIISKG